MNLERRSDPFRRPAHGVAERWTNAGSEGRIDGSDWPARTGSVLPSLDNLFDPGMIGVFLVDFGEDAIDLVFGNAALDGVSAAILGSSSFSCLAVVRGILEQPLQKSTGSFP